MEIQIEKLPSAQSLKPRDRRREPRTPVNFPVGIHTEDTRLFAGWLVDVSRLGCCIQSDDLDLRVGMILVVGPTGNDLANQPRLEAIVRWVRHTSAGLEFLHTAPTDARFWQQLLANGSRH